MYDMQKKKIKKENYLIDLWTISVTVTTPIRFHVFFRCS